MKLHLLIGTIWLFALGNMAIAEGHGDRIDETIVNQIEAQPEIAQRLINRLLEIAPDGNLSFDRYLVFKSTDESRLRSQYLGRLLIYDLDASFAIEPSEIQALRLQLLGRDRRQFEETLLTTDTNADGTIDTDEIRQAAADFAAAQNRSDTPLTLALFHMDQNADGIIDPSDILEFINNPTIVQPDPSTPEFAGRLLDLGDGSDAQGRPLEVACQFVPPSPDAEVIFLSVLEPAGLSTLAIGSPQTVTGTFVIEVSQGERPIYLISSHRQNVIISFEGHVDRIERFVGAQSRAGVGVVGLNPDRVFVRPNNACIPRAFHQAESGEATISTLQLQQELGQDIDAVFAAHTAGRVVLPTGEISRRINEDVVLGARSIDNRFYALTEDGITLSQTPTVSRENRFRVGGMVTWLPTEIVAIREADVSSAVTAQQYQVLPGMAGLLQLTLNGTLVPQSAHNSFRITREFPHFPIELHGAQSAVFFLEEGVRMPDGDPGHSTVWSEETGECLTRGRCELR